MFLTKSGLLKSVSLSNGLEVGEFNFDKENKTFDDNNNPEIYFNDLETLYNLGVFYHLGKHTTKDIDQAIKTSDFFSERERKIKEKEEKNKNFREINHYFYEGFGSDFL